MDPFNAIGNFILGKIKEGIWAAWLKLLFELGFSMVIAFLFVCGAALAQGTRGPIAIGLGMVTAAVCMVNLFRRERNRLMKGMILVLPATESQAELNTDLQLLEKPDKEK